MRPRGPYRVLQRVNTNSYEIQKIPAVRGLKRRTGNPRIEAAARMTKLPSSLVIHKRVDTMDTKFADETAQLVDRPLEYNLGLFDFGKFQQVPITEEFAWIKINKMWNEELEPEDTEDEASSEDETTEQTMQTRQEGEPRAKKKMRRQQKYMKTRSATKRVTQAIQKSNRSRKTGERISDEKLYLRSL